MAPIKVKNNDKRLQDELEQLKEKNNPLRELIFDLADWVKERFGKEVIITMIYRTDEEQDEIYKNDKKYQKKKFKSPHSFWHSADLRSWIYEKHEIEQIVEYLNEIYNDVNYYKWTAKNHDVGAGDHLHIQYYQVKEKK